MRVVVFVRANVQTRVARDLKIELQNHRPPPGRADLGAGQLRC